MDILFEYQLSEEALEISDPRLKRRKQAFESMAVLLASENDFVLVENEIPKEHLEYLQKQKIPFCQNILYLEELLSRNDSLALEEWGRISKLETGIRKIDPDKLSQSQYLCDKINQAVWKQSLEEIPIYPKLISSFEALQDFWENSNPKDFPFVLKGGFGMAGRNQIVVNSAKEGYRLASVEKKLQRFPIVLEKWVGETRFLDFSSLWEVSKNEIQFGNFQKQIMTKDGTFKASILSQAVDETLSRFFPEVKATLEGVFQIIRAEGMEYSGKLAMDGFLFREDGKTVLQPMSEINFRNSMGNFHHQLKKKWNRPKTDSLLGFYSMLDLEQTSLEKFLESRTTMSCIVSPLHDAKGKKFETVAIYSEPREISCEELYFQLMETFSK